MGLSFINLKFSGFLEEQNKIRPDNYFEAKNSEKSPPPTALIATLLDKSTK